jgi:hypothetical protein
MAGARWASFDAPESRGARSLPVNDHDTSLNALVTSLLVPLAVTLLVQ